MLNSLLLHLESSRQAASVIHLGVELASQCMARVRGLTLIDTRRAHEAHLCESVAYAVMADNRRTQTELQHDSIRSALSKACLEAQLNFDVRQCSGDPLKVLPQEARFHDLVITSADHEPGSETVSDMTQSDLVGLVHRGVQPLLLAKPKATLFQRVLLVYDGSGPSGRAIRSFLNLGIVAEADHRLLVIGENDVQSRESLREMGDYCGQRIQHLETGRVCGTAGKVLRPYVEKWQADLVVLGIARGNRLWNTLRGDLASRRLHQFASSVYLTS